MNKKEVQRRVLKGGGPLALSLFTWNEKTKTFSSEASDLLIDLSGVDGCTFKTRDGCTFITGDGCTFKTGSNCTFDTGFSCTFDTLSKCIFKTGFSCIFGTLSDCTFDTGHRCTFDTGPRCTFRTGHDCVVVRRDVFEVIKLEPSRKIRLNDYDIRGFVVLNERVKEASVSR